MPYIKEIDRLKYDGTIKNIVESGITEGDLNYIITKLALSVLKKQGERYATYNALIGIFECAKLEFYRRKVAKYEDGKIIQNGEVFTEQEESKETQTKEKDPKKDQGEAEGTGEEKCCKG